MNLPRVAPRGWLILALLATLVLVPPVAQRVNAAGGPTIAVVGDSITARYNDDPGDARQGWWSMVGRHYHHHVSTFAESGSGFQRRGNGCSGTRFADRLQALRHTEPRVVIVEGGRNDWATCSSAGLTPSLNSRVQSAADRFLTQLRTIVPTSTQIYVLGPPWGPVDAGQSERITAIIKGSAERHGMQFIDTAGVFAGRRTVDGIHPNRAGNRALAERVIAALGPTLPNP